MSFADLGPKWAHEMVTFPVESWKTVPDEVVSGLAKVEFPEPWIPGCDRHGARAYAEMGDEFASIAIQRAIHLHRRVAAMADDVTPVALASSAASTASQPGLVFYDVGCGRGKLPVLAACAQGIVRACGIEVAGNWASQSAWLCQWWEDSALKQHQVAESITYRVCDGAAEDQNTFEDGDIVLINNLVFPDGLNARMAAKANDMKPGSVLLTPVAIPSDHFQIVETSNGYHEEDEHSEELCDWDFEFPLYVQVRM